MKPTRLLTTILASGLLIPVAAEQGRSSTEELKAIREELQQLRYELEVQGKMIRDFYEYADSEIDFDKLRKKRKEETRLLLEPVLKLTDGEITRNAVAHPTRAEIAVITQTGKIRIIDYNGKVIHTFGTKGRVVSALSYSADGESLLAGSEEGFLQVFDAQTGESLSERRVADKVDRATWLDGTNAAVWVSYVRLPDLQG